MWYILTCSRLVTNAVRWKIKIHYLEIRIFTLWLRARNPDIQSESILYHAQDGNILLPVDPRNWPTAQLAMGLLHGQAAHSTGKSLQLPSLKWNEIECSYFADRTFRGKWVVHLCVPGDSLVPGMALSGLGSDRQMTKQIHREARVQWAGLRGQKRKVGVPKDSETYRFVFVF